MNHRKDFATGICALLFWPACAFADLGCEPIRPPGLSSGQVEQQVLDIISTALRNPASKIDKSRTFIELDKTDDAIFRFFFIDMRIGDSLGWDAGPAFSKAAAAKNKKQPMEALTISEIISLTQAAYAAGTDTPFPQARQDKIYQTRYFTASAPSLATGWVQIRCYFDQFAFQRLDRGKNSLSIAIARDVDLPPYKGREEFSSFLQNAAKGLLLPGVKQLTLDISVEENSRKPCGLVRFQGHTQVESGEPNSSRAYSAFARFCYDSKSPHLGFAAMFTELGVLDESEFRRQALSFINGVKPAR